MLYRSGVYLNLIVSLLVGVCLSGIFWLGLRFAQAASPESVTPGYKIELTPDQMTLLGDVTTRANCIHPTVCSWLEGTPMGTIMLGVDPTSPYTATWDGGSATTEVFLPDVYSPTVFVLKLSWPDRDGEGLHSPERNRVGSITLDGRSLWDKRTTHLSTFNDHYYAAEREPILTTIVLTQSITHTLTFSVLAETAWDLSQIELNAYPYPTTTRGIGYSPYRDCQYPGGARQPSVQDIEEDLFRLFHTTNAIRTYSARGVNGQIPALANAIGLPVFAGAWIDADPEDGVVIPGDDNEIQALIDLACTTNLEGGIVGSEYYLRHRTPDGINYLLQRIGQVKDGVRDKCGKNLPVTTGEIDNLIFTWKSSDAVVPEGINPVYRPVLDEVDFVLVHTYPFWNKLPIDGAAAFTVQRYKAIQRLIEQTYPGQHKRVIIGEAGWPSAGAPNGAALPGLENQRRYMLEFLYQAEKEGVEYMYFDAFDELWKIEEPGRVGQNWGYSYSDRTAKHNFYGVLLPAEELFPYKVYLPHITEHSAFSTSQLPVDVEVADTLPQSPIQTSNSLTFPVYAEWPAGPDHFVPTGWMGDIENIGLFECDRANPHSGEMAIRAFLSPTGTLGWGGIYWQHPENNWGTLEGGHDLTGARRLSFWVRGEQGGEVVEFLVGGLGEPTDPFPDTIRPARSTGPIVLSKTWQQVEISLAGEDLSRVIGGFAWVATRCYNSEPITFYIDDVLFDFDPAPEPIPPPTRRPFCVYGDDDPGCNHFIPSGWMGDIDDISLDKAWAGAPHSGTTAISVTYSALGSNGQGWAGVYWQEPENNWGTVEGAGFDLDEATYLRFYARGEDGGEQVKFLTGGIWGEHPDSQQPALSTDVITLTPQWAEYTVDLRGRDLRQVIGGFAFVTDQCLNPEPITFYLDDIEYVMEGDPGAPIPTPTPETPYTFDVYRDRDVAGNHYAPSGWMGDTGDIRLDECWRENTHSGSTAVRVEYTAQGTGPHYGCDGSPPCDWAGVYWQDPANNWGDRPGGYDLTGARAVTFWARGEEGGELISFKVGGIGCESAGFPDSLCPAQALDPAPVSLTTTWQVYTLPLSTDLDLSSVVGGFLWAASKEGNPHGATFYLDDIQYLFNVDIPPQPHWIYYGPRLADGYDMGVNTSGGRTDWVTDMGGNMRMAYPSGQSWGAVFITVGPPRNPPRPGKDLSRYQSLALELRGEVGGEDVWIGLKDNTDPDNGSERKILVANLTTDWQTFIFPLWAFDTADLTQLYVVTEFVFEPGTPSENVYFRHIQYLP